MVTGHVTKLEQVLKYNNVLVVCLYIKGSRSHLQPALNILKFGMNEEYTILITYMNF